jgi:ABC-2 type transport system ATP-binding protein
MDSRRDSPAIRRRVGYQPGELVQFPGCDGRVPHRVAGRAAWRVDSAPITELAERFELDLGRKYEVLSHGNK